MEAPQKFRTAFNGFHRSDVVQYLDFLNRKHQTQVNQLNLEIETLRSQLESGTEPDPQLLSQCETLKAELEACEAQLEEAKAVLAEAEEKQRRLQDQCAQLEAQRDELNGRCNALEAQCEDLSSRCEALEQQPQASQPLDTYRQAENLVRQSRTRAELVYYQTNGVLTEASAKVESAAKDITTLADQAMEELTKLQMAVSTSKHTLQDAAAMMRAIRPNE